jgi:L-ascorbate metabolism protein UlaG (beta-lactamase superfamily)
MRIGDVEINWLGHAGFLIKNSKIIYIDPFNIKEDNEKADFILLTHSHYDHCSIADISKIIKEGTKIIFPADCQSKIAKIKIPIKMIIAEPGKEFDFGTIRISTLPAYNTDKHFHPKEEGWLGYLIKMGGVLIYHAGDTDVIEEMQILTGHKQADKKLIALLPVGGRFTMNSEEAFEAAKIIKPFLAIPMHYGSIVGTEEDAKEFANFCKEENIGAEVMKKI